MRIPLVVANWKMFKTVQESVFYIKELRALMKSVRNVEVMVAPPFLALHAASEAARGTDIGIGAQNVHWEKEGAFTGEVSAAMIQEAGGEFAIIGHSERRALFGETDLMVNRKLQRDARGGPDPDCLRRRDRGAARRGPGARGTRPGSSRKGSTG